MAGDRQGARPPRARGSETNTEGTRDPMTSALLTCVHAGRRVKKTKKHGKGRKPQGRMQSGKGGGADCGKKTKPQCTAGGRIALSKQAAGERVGANCADEGPRVAREEKTQVTRLGTGTGTGGSGGGPRKKGPKQV